MKAAVLHAKQQPFSIEETAIPELQAGEARVKIYAAAFNRRDYWIQQGQYAGLKYPIILGSDGAGVVEAVGDNVSSEWIGKAVVLNPSHNWGENLSAQGKNYKILGLPDNGTFAEYVTIAAEHLVEKPAHLDWAQSAAIPLAGLTAYRALFSRAQLKAGDKVLITGIGGGVATFALQFALAAGARVFVTSGSKEKLEKAVALGASGGANYKEENWAKDLKAKAGEFEVIIDSAGGEGFNELINLAAAGGRIAFYGGTKGNIPNVSPQKLFWKQLSLLGSTMGTEKEFAEMVAYIAENQIVPVVDSIFDLADANVALEKMATSSQLGKIVLKIA